MRTNQTAPAESGIGAKRGSGCSVFTGVLLERTIINKSRLFQSIKMSCTCCSCGGVTLQGCPATSVLVQSTFHREGWR